MQAPLDDTADAMVGDLQGIVDSLAQAFGTVSDAGKALQQAASANSEKHQQELVENAGKCSRLASRALQQS